MNKTEGSYKMKWRDVIRWAIHLPMGAVPMTLILHPWLLEPDYRWSIAGVFIGITFFIYEIMEDIRVRDWSFKDVFGSLIALIATAFIILFWF